VTVWVIVPHAMANAPSLVTALHAAANALRATAIDHRAKANAPLANSTTVAHATTHHAHRATLTHLARHAVTTTTFNPAPTRTWAPKAA
jgi:hypothetical protein